MEMGGQTAKFDPIPSNQIELISFKAKGLTLTFWYFNDRNMVNAIFGR